MAASAEGIAVVRPDDGTIVSSNPQFDAVFGYGTGQLRGCRLATLFSAVGGSSTATAAAMTFALEAGGQWDGEVAAFTPDGARVWCDLRLFTVTYPGAGTVGIVTVSDKGAKPDRPAASGTLVGAEPNDISYSTDDLVQLASVAAHDLRSPLQAVMGFGELLSDLECVRNDPEASEYAGLLLQSAQRMQALVDGLLHYCRVGIATREWRPVDCSVVFAEVVREHSAEIADAQAVVTSDDLPVVHGDRGLLYAVLSNLLSNAIKFHAATTAPRVHLSAGHAGGEWRFAVADNGIGMEARFRDRAFEMFRRLPGSEAYAGTGIGLAICKRAVETLGGRIWAEAGPDGGTTMCFTVPAPTDVPPS